MTLAGIGRSVMKTPMRAEKTVVGGLLVFMACFTGCENISEGNLLVFLQAQNAIPDGLQAGDEDGEIVDGYEVHFRKYIISVGDVAMSQDGADPIVTDNVRVADYTDLPDTVLELEAFREIPIGRYSEFGFQTAPPDEDLPRTRDVSEADFEAMVENGWSYIIRGTVNRMNADEEDRVRFLIEADVATAYTNCGIGGASGIAVTHSSEVEITMHGDRLFYNGFPQSQSDVQLRAGWLDNVADIDEDEVITRVDLEAAEDLEAIFDPFAAYDRLSGSPIPIENAWDFVRAQLSLQGHIFGDGPCDSSGPGPTVPQAAQ